MCNGSQEITSQMYPPGIGNIMTTMIRAKSNNSVRSLGLHKRWQNQIFGLRFGTALEDDTEKRALHSEAKKLRCYSSLEVVKAFPIMSELCDAHCRAFRYHSDDDVELSPSNVNKQDQDRWRSAKNPMTFHWSSGNVVVYPSPILKAPRICSPHIPYDVTIILSLHYLLPSAALAGHSLLWSLQTKCLLQMAFYVISRRCTAARGMKDERHDGREGEEITLACMFKERGNPNLKTNCQPSLLGSSAGARSIFVGQDAGGGCTKPRNDNDRRFQDASLTIIEQETHYSGGSAFLVPLDDRKPVGLHHPYPIYLGPEEAESSL
ncbi:hypothetical protein IW262DRAFT_1296870 [Armillaria fumosa]|nr:hypothetical protein IW262DRAFT_1296870 [Armillaria fumosa]